MARVSLTRRLVAIVAALLQLTLPLAGYARTAFAPGDADICSANIRRNGDHRPAGAPAGKHASTHCALCAHATPPALPMTPPSLLPPACAVTLRTVAAPLLLPQRLPTPANARAPPGPATVPT